MDSLSDRLTRIARLEGLTPPPEDAVRQQLFGCLEELLREVNAELSEAKPIVPSTVHVLRSLDLVSSPGRGRGAAWTGTQAREIVLVRLLQEKGLSLRSIRERVGAGRSTVLPAPSADPGPAPSAVHEVPRPAPARFRAAVLEAIPLAPGVEILVRPPLAPRDEWALGHLLEEAERLFRR